MLDNLFKTEEQRQTEIIEEIHEQFDTAQDRLQQEAEAFLSSIKMPKESGIEKKAEQLKALGFENTEDVKFDAKFKEKRAVVSKEMDAKRELSEMIQYYKDEYPQLKFVTVDELDRICEKYGLIHAPVVNYIKTVPDKNLNDITNAKPLSKEDVKHDDFRLLHSDKQKEIDNTLEAIGLSPKGFTQKELRDKIVASYGQCPLGWDDPRIGTTGLYVLNREKSIRFEHCETISREGLFIAAPPSHFNTKGLERKGKHGFFKVTRTEVKDPIVFRYVKGGIQVLTMWGDEKFEPHMEPSLIVEGNN